MDEQINSKQITEDDLMKEFMEITAHSKTQKENELTVDNFIEKAGVPKGRARYILKKYEDAGILQSRKVQIGSDIVNAYSPNHGTWKDVVKAIKQEE